MSDAKELLFYIDSEWDFKPPVVRVWVDDMLISERAVTPKKQQGNYLLEALTISLSPGKHKIIVENIKVALAEIHLHAITLGGVHIPFKSIDDIKYEATVEI